MEAALRAGYKLLDCAFIYGNEAEIGEALQRCFKEGTVSREELFITSKLWSAHSTLHNNMIYTVYRCGHLAPEDVLPACQLTLKNLQVDYLDLYLMHAPFRLRKGAFYPFKEGDILGYDPEAISQCWEASLAHEHL